MRTWKLEIEVSDDGLGLDTRGNEVDNDYLHKDQIQDLFESIETPSGIEVQVKSISEGANDSAKRHNET
jgi:hypothetical protein